jgi:hypothetical protein
MRSDRNLKVVLVQLVADILGWSECRFLTTGAWSGLGLSLPLPTSSSVTGKDTSPEAAPKVSAPPLEPLWHEGHESR